MEKARGFRALQHELGLSQDQVAERVGLQRATIANHMRLLELPAAVQEGVSRGVLSMGHARALLGLRDAAAQLRMLERIAREDLSVRTVEGLVRTATQPAAPAASAVAEAPPPAPPPWTRDVQRRLQESLGTRVRLSSDEACRGQIVIDFYQRADLDRLLGVLAPPRDLR
jgi:ParB family transcriptional regulator, chromosome partitioning protein